MHLCRPHDLLKVDPKGLLAGPAPPWVSDHLRRSPWVVVRRAVGVEPGIPIGVRGSQRHQRWAAACQPNWIETILMPSQLLTRAVSDSRMDTAPPFRALETLKQRWRDLDLAWGPGGSVGFELATDIPVVKPESDLDIVIQAGRPITPVTASVLSDSADGLVAPVDIRVETPCCGFALREYARNSPAPILLRTASGVMLGANPWTSAIQG